MRGCAGVREEKGACDAGPCECGGGGGRLWKNVRGASFVAVCPPMLHNVTIGRQLERVVIALCKGCEDG